MIPISRNILPLRSTGQGIHSLMVSQPIHKDSSHLPLAEATGTHTHWKLLWIYKSLTQLLISQCLQCKIS